MNYQIIKETNSSKIIKSPDIEIEGMSRRDFLILASITPLVMMPTTSDAIWFALLFRLFARSVVGGLVRRGVSSGVRSISRSAIRQGQKNVSVKKAIKIDSSKKRVDSKGMSIGDIIDYQELLANQVWDKNGNNESNIIIENQKSYTQNTKDIEVKLYDENKNNHVDIHARIEPIDIPPKSRLILDLNFKNLPSEGMKRLHGSYGDSHQAETSGKILVTSNRRGISIDELYQKYENKNDLSNSRLIY